jgi:hypothetical protein
MPKKICTLCQVPKILKEFNIKRRAPDGRQNVCRECNSEKGKKYYLANKEKHKLAVSIHKEKYKQEVHQWIVNYLAEHGCSDCPEKDVRCLEFDHVRGKKSRNISTMIVNICSIETLKLEIQKCDVRCANCHRKRTSDMQGWYKSGL